MDTKLTSAQKTALAEILAAGTDGLLTDASWTAAQSLVRKGLVKATVEAKNVPATKVYPNATSRFQTHTVQGRLRHFTMVRWTKA